jgi:hypothetical protein
LFIKPSGVDRVISRAEILRSGRWLNPKGWAREIMEKLRAVPHSEPLTDTWTSDFLSREGEDREVVGERLRDKTVPWQVQRRLMQAMTNSSQCGAHLHRMGLRRSYECTLCQRAWEQRKDDQHEGCERSDPETLGHIQSGLSGTSGLASNPANREIASSSGASEHQDIIFFRFFFWKKT